MTEFYRKIHSNDHITQKSYLLAGEIWTFWYIFLPWKRPRVNCGTNVDQTRLGLPLTAVIFSTQFHNNILNHAVSIYFIGWRIFHIGISHCKCKNINLILIYHELYAVAYYCLQIDFLILFFKVRHWVIFVDYTAKMIGWSTLEKMLTEKDDLKFG